MSGFDHFGHFLETLTGVRELGECLIDGLAIAAIHVHGDEFVACFEHKRVGQSTWNTEPLHQMGGGAGYIPLHRFPRLKISRGKRAITDWLFLAPRNEARVG
jgi:hypothetical protein